MRHLLHLVNRLLSNYCVWFLKVHGEHLLDMLIALDQGSSEQLTRTKAVNPLHYSHGEVLEPLMPGEAVAAGGVKYIRFEDFMYQSHASFTHFIFSFQHSEY